MGGLPFFLFAWLFSGAGRRRRDQTRRAPNAPPPPPPPPQAEPTPPPASVPTPIVTPATPAAVKYSQPVPWPQVVPSGLPPFPSSAWTPDVPVGPGVAARAAQLLVQLWRSGAGTFKVEQTAGRWIAYRATPMGSKHGVVAYRLVSPSSSSSSSTSAFAPSPATATPATYRTALPILRRGSRGPSVVTLQQRLGIDTDGAFGPATERAVQAFQRAHGLSPDGVVGRDTWTALYG